MLRALFVTFLTMNLIGQVAVADKCGAMSRLGTLTRKEFFKTSMSLVPGLAELVGRRFGDRSQYEDLVSIGQLTVLELHHRKVRTNYNVKAAIYGGMSEYMKKRAPYQRVFKDVKNLEQAQLLLRAQLSREPSVMETAVQLDWDYEKVKRVQFIAAGLSKVNKEIKEEKRGWTDPTAKNRFLGLTETVPFKDPITKITGKGDFPRFQGEDDELHSDRTGGFLEIADSGAYEDPLFLLTEIEDHRILEQAIKSLPPREKEVVDLILVEGLRPAEVAQKLDMGRSNVSMILAKVKERLRLALGI